MTYRPNPLFDFCVRSLALLAFIAAILICVMWLIVLPLLGNPHAVRHLQAFARLLITQF